MKFIITLILCFSMFLIVPLKAQTNPPPSKGVLLLTIILTAVAIGGYFVMKAAKNIPNQDTPVTIVLESSTDHSTWIPIATNTVTLHGTDPIEFFRTQMTSDSMFYRARVVR
jgi:hypothetical protein